MTALAIFGICIAIAVALILLFITIAGSNSLLLLIIFPAIVAEGITGESGFDFKRKSFVYRGLFYLLILMQVLALAVVFFGFYCLFFGFPLATPEADKVTIAANIDYLLILNKSLLALASYFFVRFIYGAIKYRARLGELKGLNFFRIRVAPAISYPLAITYLLACHKYLLNFPDGDPIGLLPKIASFICVPFIIYLLITTVIDCSRILHHGVSQFGVNYWLNLFVSLVYYIGFLYFFYQVNFILSRV